RAHVGAAEVGGKFLRRQRLFRGEQRCLDAADKVIHHPDNPVPVEGTAFTRRKCSGPKASSCRSSALPSRASSSAARKLEASAERLRRLSAFAGRKSRN